MHLGQKVRFTREGYEKVGVVYRMVPKGTRPKVDQPGLYAMFVPEPRQEDGFLVISNQFIFWPHNIDFL